MILHGWNLDMDMTLECATEMAVLGGLLVRPDAITTVAGNIHAHHFEITRHRAVFEAILKTWEEGRQVDIVSVMHTLRAMGKLDMVGPVWLSCLTQPVCNDSHLPTWCLLVREQYRRKLMGTASVELVRAGDPSEDADELLEEVGEILSEASRSEQEEDQVSASVVWADIVNAPPDPAPMKMGLGELDNVVGLTEGTVSLIGAPPGVGKTAFALNVCLNVAEGEERVWMVSVEMRARDFIKRAQSVYTGIDGWRLQTGQITTEERDQIAGMHAGLDKVLGRIAIDNRGEMHLHRFMAEAERKVKREGVKLIVVDYIQLLQADMKLKGEYERVTAVSHALRRTARVLGTRILGLSQLRRKEGGGKPTMHDLRSTGQLEADAALIMLLDTATTGRMEVDVVKHRFGPTRSVMLDYQPECFRMGPRANAPTLRRDLDEPMDKPF